MMKQEGFMMAYWERMSMMYGKGLTGLLLCGVLLAGGAAEASGEFSYKSAVLAHRAPDGSLGFVAGPDLPVLKVYAVDGAAPVYYIRFEAKKGTFKKAAGLHARILADGQEISLTPVGDEERMHSSKWFEGWYRLPADGVAAMGGAAEFSFQVVDAGNQVLWTQKGKLKTAEAMQKITKAAPQDYLREGRIRAESAAESVRADSRPRVFLPAVTPETVQVRIYDYLEELKKDKETKADWQGFTLYVHTNKRILVAMGDSIGDSIPLVTFETIPYQGGTLLAMMKDQEYYDKYAKQFFTVGMMTADGFVIDLTPAWRGTADRWDGFLNQLYREMSPHAEFPFDISDKSVKGEGNRFFIKESRTAQLTAGDEILAVDGASAAWYKPNELRLVLLQKQGPALFRIRRVDGREEEISVAPEMTAPARMPAEMMDDEKRGAYFAEKKARGSESYVHTQGNYPQLFSLMDESYR